jgi:hypothetical protein
MTLAAAASARSDVFDASRAIAKARATGASPATMARLWAALRVAEAAQQLAEARIKLAFAEAAETVKQQGAA